MTPDPNNYLISNKVLLDNFGRKKCVSLNGIILGLSLILKKILLYVAKINHVRFNFKYYFIIK